MLVDDLRRSRVSAHDSRSITWHQWHHTAPMSSRIGLSSLAARSNAASPHSIHPTGWRIADRRYAEAALASAFVRPFSLSFASPSCCTLAVRPLLNASSITACDFPGVPYKFLVPDWCPKASQTPPPTLLPAPLSLVPCVRPPIPRKFHPAPPRVTEVCP